MESSFIHNLCKLEATQSFTWQREKQTAFPPDDDTALGKQDQAAGAGTARGSQVYCAEKKGPDTRGCIL